MIIYDSSVKDFIKNSKSPLQLAAIIRKNLLEKFGIKVAENEQRSWTRSLPKIADLLIQSKNDHRKVLIEFNIPCSKKRVDFIILGKNKDNKPSAWIVELKQWSQVTEVQWNEFRVSKYIDAHPSFQAKDYQEIINEQMGLRKLVDVKASAYLHNMKNKNNALFKGEYQDILNKAYLYIQNEQKKLKNSIKFHTIIKNGNKAFSYFKDMKWMPTKKFQDVVKEDFENIKLIGSQELIYQKIKKFIKNKKHSDKLTFLISGDPGSGKTIIAFKLLNLLVLELKMNIQMMLPGQELRAAFKKQLYSKALSNNISGSTIWKDFDAAIIDEGHKAIAINKGLINYQRNYEKLKFAIIFIDDDQVINRKGVTKQEVKEIAQKNDHKVYEYNVEENFRNNGERQLLDWIDTNFYNRKITFGDVEYQQENYVNKNQNYKLYSYKNAKDFTDSYFKVRKENTSTRIVSFWSQSFYIGPADKNGFPKPTLFIGKEGFIWNPNEEWKKTLNDNNVEYFKNYNKEVKRFANNRDLFLTSNPHERFIAYFNHIQGYEFKNIFVYIPKVFTYENQEIIFHRNRLAKEVRISQTWSLNSTSKGLKNQDPYLLNKKYFLNRLKVMLTRGTSSTHVFAEDKNLNDYINKKIDFKFQKKNQKFFNLIKISIKKIIFLLIHKK